MKLNSRTRGAFVTFVLLGILIGSLAWEVLERVLLELGLELSVGVGPVGFDLSVLALYLRINPGTLLGALGGVLLFSLM
jgi:hypothetical protein